MTTRLEALAELDRRGELNPEMSAALKELQRRQQSIDVQQAEADQPLSTPEAFALSFAKGIQNPALGAADIAGSERAAQIAAQNEAGLAQIRAQSPITSAIGEGVGELFGLPLGAFGIPGKLGKVGEFLKLGGTGGKVLTGSGIGAASAATSETARGKVLEDAESAATIGGIAGGVVESLAGPAKRLVEPVKTLAGIAAEGVIEIGRRSSRALPEPMQKFVTKILGEKKVKSLNLLDESGKLTPKGEDALRASNLSEEEFNKVLADSPKEVRDAIEQLPTALAGRQAEAVSVTGELLTGGQVTGDFGLRRQESFLKSQVNQAGVEARIGGSAQTEGFQEASTRVIQNIMGEVQLQGAEIGSAIKGGLESAEEVAKLQLDEFYNVIGGLPGGNQPLSLGAVDGQLPSLQREFAGNPGLMKGIEDAIDDFSDLTLASVPQFKARLNNLWDAGNKQTQAIIASVKRTLDDSANRLIEQFPEGSAVRNASENARRAAIQNFDDFSSKDIIDNLTAFKRGTSTEVVDPSVVVNKIFGAPNSLENITRVKNILTKKPTAASASAWKQMQGSGFERIMTNVFVDKPGVGTVIDGKKLKANLDRMGSESMDVLFGSNKSAVDRLTRILGDASFVLPKKGEEKGAIREVLGIIGLIGARLSPIKGLSATQRAAQLARRGGQFLQRSMDEGELLESINQGIPPKPLLDSFKGTLKNDAERIDAARGFIEQMSLIGILEAQAKRAVADVGAEQFQRPRDQEPLRVQ